MLSRVADAIYWASRYVERAENVARFVEVNLNLMLETPVGRRPSWRPLVMTTGDHEQFERHHRDATPEAVAWFLTFDPSYSNSILSSLSLARDNARSVREIISREMWQELNEFYLMVKHHSREPFRLGEMGDFFHRVKMSGIHYEGVTNATLSRGEAWSFARLGRLLERADKTSRILDVQYYLLSSSPSEVGAAVDQVGWGALLNSASALQMYRQHHHDTSPEKVARFLLLNRQFPRAIAYSVSEAQLSLHAITGTPIKAANHESERALGRLQANLAYSTIQDVMAEGLHEYIDRLQSSLNAVGAAIQAGFFGYAPVEPAPAEPDTQSQSTSASASA
ncbi:MAG TPA: alpha-E domain-containing protein [Polyangiaceae bacterium]|nr:alpha-E domain-containing protein [Polyangiaceae bacterium]